MKYRVFLATVVVALTLVGCYRSWERAIADFKESFRAKLYKLSDCWGGLEWESCAIEIKTPSAHVHATYSSGGNSVYFEAFGDGELMWVHASTRPEKTKDPNYKIVGMWMLVEGKTFRSDTTTNPPELNRPAEDLARLLHSSLQSL